MMRSRDEEKKRNLTKDVLLPTAAAGTIIGSGLVVKNAINRNSQDLSDSVKKVASSAKKTTEAAGKISENVKKHGIKALLVGEKGIKRGQDKRHKKMMKKSRKKRELHRQNINNVRQKGESIKKAAAFARRTFKYESLADLLEFDTDSVATYNAIRNAIRKGRFAGEIAQDLNELRKGERRNKRKKRFWEKKSVQNAALALAGVGGIAAYKHRGKIKSKAKEAGGHASKLKDKIMDYVDNFEDVSFVCELDDGRLLMELDDNWYISKPTESSVRVHTKGKKRHRRRKRWHERKNNRDKMMAAAAIAATVGIPAAALVGSRRGKHKFYKETVERSPTGAGGIVRPKNFREEWNPKTRKWDKVSKETARQHREVEEGLYPKEGSQKKKKKEKKN